MPVLTIKGMPPALYRELKKRAAEHRRSLNSEILLLLEQSVRSVRPNAQGLLKRADELRAQVKGPKVTERWLRAAKAWGRE